jgi:hypothetical protein
MDGALGYEYDNHFPFGEGPNTKAANIKVAVRCRPPLENEIKNGNTFEKLRIDQVSKGVRLVNLILFLSNISKVHGMREIKIIKLQNLI